jgi:hypothetical protein
MDLAQSIRQELITIINSSTHYWRMVTLVNACLIISFDQFCILALTLKKKFNLCIFMHASDCLFDP